MLDTLTILLAWTSRSTPVPDFDVLTATARPPDDCVLQKWLRSIEAYVAGPRATVYVVSPHCAAWLASPLVKCIDEDAAVPGVTKAGIERVFDAQDTPKEYNGRSTAGWYLQQLLKLGVALHLPVLKPWYLVVDSDMLFVRPFSPFDGAGRGVLTPGGFGEPYEHAVRKLLHTAPERSYAYPHYAYVSHQMLMARSVVAEMLRVFASAHMPHGGVANRSTGHRAGLAASHPNNASAGVRMPGWAHAILKVAMASPDPLHGFSEFETYATFALRNHPSLYVGGWTYAPTFKREPWLPLSVTWMRGGTCCPTWFDSGLAWLLMQYYVGFETGHTAVCRGRQARTSEAALEKRLPAAPQPSLPLSSRSSASLARPCPHTFGAWLAAAKRRPEKPLSYLPVGGWILYDPKHIANISVRPIVQTLRAEAEAFAATRYGYDGSLTRPGLMVVHFRVGDFLRHTNESVMLGLVEAMLAVVRRSGIAPEEIVVLNGGADFDCCASDVAADGPALREASARVIQRLWVGLSHLYPRSKMEHNPPGNSDTDFLLAASAIYLVTGAGSFAVSAALVNTGLCFSPSLVNMNFPADGRGPTFSLRGGDWRFY